MRLLGFLVALAACAEEETPEDRFRAFEAKVEVECGSWSHNTATCAGHEEAKAQQALTCMTDALASGKRAVMTVSSQDSRMFGFTTYTFTADQQVKVFDYYSGQSSTSAEPRVASEKSCSGDFRVIDWPCPSGSGAYFVVVVDGC